MADGKKITALILNKYPHPTTALTFSNPLELLVAAILSAQCTDTRVNQVTKELFRRYRTAEDYAHAELARLEQQIKPTGFYKHKAQTIIACGQKLLAEFDGEVPATRAELTTLPGVGRKTANVVLGNAFGRQTIAVDTHVLRVSNRLGLADSQEPEKVEWALMEQVPHTDWTAFSHALIWHGRETCTARNPRCCDCVLYKECEWPEKLVCRDDFATASTQASDGS